MLDRNMIKYHKIIIVRESHVENHILQKNPTFYITVEAWLIGANAGV
jgi:hypothetical protein